MQRKPLILGSLLLAAFAINLDTTIVNVALPALVRELHASTTELEWIVDAYNLVFAALVLAAGNLGDRVGRKGVLLAGLGVFGVATVAGGVCTNPGELIAARAVMGLGAALIFPATLSLLTNVFTERGERARAIGLWGATTGVGIAVGPIVGGWLLEDFSWSSVFFALAPVAALGAALVFVSVPTSRDPDAPPADRAGLALSTGAMGLLIYTIIEAPNHGWASTRSVGGFVVAVGLLGTFVVWERRARTPMLDVRLFRNLRFSAASGAVTIHLLLADGLHLPRHALLPVPEGLRATVHRGAPAPCRHHRGNYLGPRHQVGGAQRHQTRHRRRARGARRRTRVDLIGVHGHELFDDCRPDGADRRRDRADERARHRVDHGRGAGGQGRRRLGH
jgi:MFS family permease